MQTMLLGSAIHKGNVVPGGTQIFRIAGIAATQADSPVILARVAGYERRFILRDEYIALIKLYREYLFGS